MTVGRLACSFGQIVDCRQMARDDVKRFVDAFGGVNEARTFAELATAALPGETRDQGRYVARVHRLKHEAEQLGYRFKSERGVGYRLLARPSARILPAPPDPFFGRDGLIARLVETIGPGKVCTCHGLAGYGKTALALVVANRLDQGGGWPADVTWISFPRDLRDNDALPWVASSVGLAQTRNPVDSIIERYRNSSTLVVLDQADSVRVSCTELVPRLIADCPDVAVLVTGTVPLGIMGELKFAVADLDPGPAADLFVEHARKLGIDPPTTERRVRLVEQICESRGFNARLIELAAGHLRTKGLPQILGRRRLDVGDAEEQSRANFALFDDDCQRVLAAMSVLRSPFALDDPTAAIVGIPREALEHLADAKLVGTALRRVSAEMTRPRFQLDPFIVGPASKRFAEPDMEAARSQTERELRRCVLTWVEDVPPAGRVGWLSRIDLHYATIVKALDALELQDAARALLQLLPFWQTRGRFADGLLVLEATASRAAGGPLEHHKEALAQIDIARGFLALQLVNRPGSADWFTEGAKAARIVEREDLVALAHFGLALSGGDPRDAHEAAERTDLPAWATADALVFRGWTAYASADYKGAEVEFEAAALYAHNRKEQRSEASARLGQAWVARRCCRLGEAEKWAEKAKHLAGGLGDHGLVANVLNTEAEFARCRNGPDDLAKAEALLREGEAAARRAAVPWIVGRLQGSLGEVLRMQATTRAELHEAREYLADSLVTAERWNAGSDQGWRYFGLSIIASSLGDLHGARAALDEALRIVEPGRRSDGVDGIEVVGRRDPWQAARCHQRLARLDLSEDQKSLEAVRTLLDAARGQLRFEALDDLTWTLQDLEVACVGHEEWSLAARLHGARLGVLEVIAFGMRSPETHAASLDPYAKLIRRGRERSRDSLPTWDSEVATERTLLAERSEIRHRVIDLLEHVERRLLR
jgi:hypothetical protein